MTADPRRGPVAIVVPGGRHPACEAYREQIRALAAEVVASGRPLHEIRLGTFGIDGQSSDSDSGDTWATSGSPAVPVGPGVLAPGSTVARLLGRFADIAGCTVVAPRHGGLLWAVAAQRRQGAAFLDTALVVVGPPAADQRENEGRRVGSLEEAVGDQLERAVLEQCAATVDIGHRGHAALSAPPPPLPAPGPSVEAITAIITHYERPALVRRALDSLLAQSRLPEEIIVVDDGSTDAASVENLRAIEDLQIEVPIRVLRQENQGLGAARNHGLRAAVHDVVAFLDDDDEAEPDYLRRMAAAMEATGAVAVAVGFKVFPDTLGCLAALEESSQWLFAAEAGSLSALDNFIGGATAMFRRGPVLDLGGFHQHRTLAYEDWQLLSRLLLSGHHVETVPQPLLRYRVSSDSMLRTFPVGASHDLVLQAHAEVLPEAIREWPFLLCGLHAELVRQHRVAGDLEERMQQLHRELLSAEHEVQRLRQVEANHHLVLRSTSWQAARLLMKAETSRRMLWSRLHRSRS